jgi:hypothetical protein
MSWRGVVASCFTTPNPSNTHNVPTLTVPQITLRRRQPLTLGSSREQAYWSSSTYKCLTVLPRTYRQDGVAIGYESADSAGNTTFHRGFCLTLRRVPGIFLRDPAFWRMIRRAPAAGRVVTTPPCEGPCQNREDSSLNRLDRHSGCSGRRRFGDTGISSAEVG